MMRLPNDGACSTPLVLQIAGVEQGPALFPAGERDWVTLTKPGKLTNDSLTS